MWPCAALWPLTATQTQLMWLPLNGSEAIVSLVYWKYYTLHYTQLYCQTLRGDKRGCVHAPKIFKYAILHRLLQGFWLYSNEMYFFLHTQNTSNGYIQEYYKSNFSCGGNYLANILMRSNHGNWCGREDREKSPMRHVTWSFILFPALEGMDLQYVMAGSTDMHMQFKAERIFDYAEHFSTKKLQCNFTPALMWDHCCSI